MISTLSWQFLESGEEEEETVAVIIIAISDSVDSVPTKLPRISEGYAGYDIKSWTLIREGRFLANNNCV